MPLISVIVPVYKVEKYVERCIRSIIGQSMTDFELLLIDDGTPDKAGIICEEWAKRDRRIKVFHKDNGGLSDARNYGIDRATGDYLTFVDSDDYVDTDYLAYLYGLIQDVPNCAVSACNHYIVRGKKRTKNIKMKNASVVYTKEDVLAEGLWHGKYDVSAWAKLYRKDVFETLRYPKGHLYEDTYVFGEIAEKVSTFVFGNRCLYYYIQHKGSIVNSGFSGKQLEYIESVNKLVCHARLISPELEMACTRRLIHAKLSVLRYMENCDKEYFPLRNKLRTQVLGESKRVFWNSRKSNV